MDIIETNPPVEVLNEPVELVEPSEPGELQAESEQADAPDTADLPVVETADGEV